LKSLATEVAHLQNAISDLTHTAMDVAMLVHTDDYQQRLELVRHILYYVKEATSPWMNQRVGDFCRYLSASKRDAALEAIAYVDEEEEEEDDT